MNSEKSIGDFSTTAADNIETVGMQMPISKENTSSITEQPEALLNKGTELSSKSSNDPPPSYADVTEQKDLFRNVVLISKERGYGFKLATDSESRLPPVITEIVTGGIAHDSGQLEPGDAIFEVISIIFRLLSLFILDGQFNWRIASIFSHI